jgi:hypothetical protein
MAEGHVYSAVVSEVIYVETSRRNKPRHPKSVGKPRTPFCLLDGNGGRGVLGELKDSVHIGGIV